MCDEPKVSDEQFSDKSPLEIAQDELDVMCKRMCKLRIRWQSMPDGSEAKIELRGVMKELKRQIVNKQLDYDDEGIKVAIVTSKFGFPIRVDYQWKRDVFD